MRNQVMAKRAPDGISAVGFQGNVRKQEDAQRVVEATVKHFGKLNILVIAAADLLVLLPEVLPHLTADPPHELSFCASPDALLGPHDAEASPPLVHLFAVLRVEVKHAELLKVSPGDGMIVHLSQASLGKLKKERGNESICLFVNVDGKKFVLGTLFSEKLPQQQIDLVFDQDFELSHNWKSGSVYLYGYKPSNPFEEDELSAEESDDSESEENVPPNLANNGLSVPKAKKGTPVEEESANAAKTKESGAAKQNVKIAEPSKSVNPEEEDESSDDAMSEDDCEVCITRFQLLQYCMELYVSFIFA